MSDTDEGVPESVWVKWSEKIENDEYRVLKKIVSDDSGNYEIKFLSPLGRGVSGSVYLTNINSLKLEESLNGMVYALKIFNNNAASYSHAQSETTILPLVHKFVSKSKCGSITNYYGSFYISGHPSVILELGGPTILQTIGWKKFTGFPLTLIRQVLLKLLTSLSEMEYKGIVHGDIKPENVLFSLRKYGGFRKFTDYKECMAQISHSFMREEYDSISQMDVFMIDWSSSSIGFQQKAPYMQSRYYRAPEILLRTQYGPAVDVWSTGCLAAEMFLGSPLFPGENELEMLRIIQYRLGVFPSSIIKQMGESSVAKNSTEWIIDPKSYIPGTFETYIREYSGRDDFEMLTFVNLLRLMLQLNPDARITASAALFHPFITGEIQKRIRGRKESLSDNFGRKKSLRGSLPKDL